MPADRMPRSVVARLGAVVLSSGLAALAAVESAPAPGLSAAEAATAEAQAALERGDAASAREAIRRALMLRPDHAAAHRLSAQLGIPAPPDLTASHAQSAEQASADLRAACDDGGFLIAAGRAREAVARLVQALAAAGEAVDPLVATRARALLDQAERAERRAVDDGSIAIQAASAAEARAQAAGAAVRTASLRRERIARILDLRHRGHLELALAQCRQLLTALPADEGVDTLFRSLLAAVHEQRRTAFAERDVAVRAELAARLERSMIPEGLDGMPVFPADWDARRTGRDGVLEVPMQAPAWKTALLDRLEQRISIAFEATPAAEAVALLARIANLNLIAAPGIAAGDHTVTLRVNGMRLRDVVDWIATQVGTRWSLSEGAVYLGDEVQTTRVTAVHDVASLLSAVEDFAGPAIGFGDRNGGGQGILAPVVEAAPALTPDDLAELIRRAVSPRIWSEDGNAIAIQGTMLVVTASDEVQRLVREFLRAQSDLRSLAVRVETRWLEISDIFLEEIGVQWRSAAGDMIATGINDRNQGGILRSVHGWEVDGGTLNRMPDSTLRVRNAPGSGLTLQAALIGGTSLSPVLAAIERGAQARVLQALDLTCLNGQRAYVFYGDETAFVSDYEVASAQLDSVTSTLAVGTVLDVRPLVSSDRRYVTMDLRSSTSNVSFYAETMTTIRAIPGNEVDANGDQIDIGVSTGFTVEVPNVAVSEAATTVTIPDKGSLLVGGFLRSVDQFTASRVPLLGSIPFLGRLFGARGRYSDRTQLALLSTVTIISYPELEAAR